MNPLPEAEVLPPEDWANCSTPDCQNKVCLWLGSEEVPNRFCYPCTVVGALRHVVNSSHGYKPLSCEGCSQVFRILRGNPR